MRAWLAGGTVRDMLLGLVPTDYDLVIDGDPKPAARGFADLTGGSFVMLSERFGACRVVGRDGGLTWDFTSLRGAGIEADLRERDFTVNAIAADLYGDGRLIDPCGGLPDLENRSLVAVSTRIFSDDPLRLLRALRLEKTHALSISAKLAALISKNAPLALSPAAERIFAELAVLLAEPGTAAAVRRLDALGLLAVLLPELLALKGVEQNRYHHLDVFEHTLAHAEALERIIEAPASFFPEAGGASRRRRPRRRISGNTTWLFLMGFTSLMHDIAKPGCAFVDDDGEIRFFKHELRGSEVAAGILARLKAGRRLRLAVSQLVGGHMRFEALIQLKDPNLRARWRYLRATAPFTPELIMLSVADRLSVRGPLVSGADIDRHLQLARDMMNMSMAEEATTPPPVLVGGNELMDELGIEPGPLVGRLIGYINEEQQLGLISSREEALATARKVLERGDELT